MALSRKGRAALLAGAAAFLLGTLVFLFVRTRAELKAKMPRAVAALKPGSAIWVFFRKGSRDAGLDMNRDTVWAVAEKLDMRPLGLVGINEIWCAFRLRRAAQVST